MKRHFTSKKATKSTEKTIINSYYTDEYKSVVCSQSYLGKKGYTIAKSSLHKDDLEFFNPTLR